jgi:uncharacterized damage-inducible protein DinB
METLRETLVHNDWAMRRLFDEAARCSDAELDRPFELFRTGFATIRATLRHVQEVERVWLGRLEGRPAAPPDAAAPALATIRERWEGTAAARATCLAGLPPGAGARRVEGVTRAGEAFALPLGDILLHLADHGIHHRAQALAMLRALGHATPIGIDYLFMRGDRPTLPWPEDMKRDWRARGFPVRDKVEAPARLDRDTLREYLRYSDWATRQVIDAARPLEDAQLDRSLPIGLRTLRKTLTHLRDAEEWWVGNWTGRGDGSFRHLPDTTGLGELTRLLEESIAARDAFLDGCDGEKLLAAVTVEVAPGAPLTFRIAESVMQLPTHGTHHRAQALAILRALGARAPELSYFRYAQQRYRG